MQPGSLQKRIPFGQPCNESRYITLRRMVGVLDRPIAASLANGGEHIVVEDAFYDSVLILERGNIKSCRDDGDKVVRGDDVDALAAKADSSGPRYGAIANGRVAYPPLIAVERVPAHPK